MLDSRKTTSFERLDKKVEEYINLAKGIVNDEMDDEKRYNALAGLYKHIDSENGGYVDMLKEEPDDKVDNYIRKQNIDTESQAPRTGNSLSKLFDYLKKKESEITLRSTVNGVEHYAFGMNWLPQDGVIPAQVLLFILMEMIRQDGEYYWLQVKIRKNKTLPIFWLREKKMEIKLSKEIQEQAAAADEKLKKLVEEMQEKYINPELSQELKQQFAESEAKMKQFAEEMGGQIREASEEGKRKAQEALSVRFAGVAPDGRPIMEYSEEIQKIQQEQQAQRQARSKARIEAERKLIKEISDEDETWKPQPGKQVSRERLFSRVGRQADDIKYYLDLSVKNKSIQSELDVFRGLNNVLLEMWLANGGYAYISPMIHGDDFNALLQDIAYPEDKNYSFRGLLRHIDKCADGGVDVWWFHKNEKGFTRVESFFTLLMSELAGDVFTRFRLLDNMNKLTPDDKERWRSMPFFKKTLFTSEIHVGNAKHNEQVPNEDKKAPLTHIMMDSAKAKKLYKALKDKRVQWIVVPLKEDEFVNRLTLPPSEKKIKLHQLCQIRYIARHFIFPPEPGKTIRRFKPEEWILIRQIFEAEDGKMSRVDRANKDPQNHETVDQIMGI